MRDLYQQGELTAFEHDFTFADGGTVSLGVSMDECQAKADAGWKDLMTFAHQQGAF
jgi:hypothetical protein